MGFGGVNHISIRGLLFENISKKGVIFYSLSRVHLPAVSVTCIKKKFENFAKNEIGIWEPPCGFYDSYRVAYGVYPEILLCSYILVKHCIFDFTQNTVLIFPYEVHRRTLTGLSSSNGGSDKGQKSNM